MLYLINIFLRHHYPCVLWIAKEGKLTVENGLKLSESKEKAGRLHHSQPLFIVCSMTSVAEHPHGTLPYSFAYSFVQNRMAKGIEPRSLVLTAGRRL